MDDSVARLIQPRPRGLVPGSIEWLREVEGPRLVKRLVDEVHANKVGEMTPTQARCASMVLDRVLPTLQAHHHTVEGELSRKTTEELKAELKAILGNDVQDAQIIEMRGTPIEAQAPEQAASSTRQECPAPASHTAQTSRA